MRTSRKGVKFHVTRIIHTTILCEKSEINQFDTVDHVLGKGEVDSSILSGSTRNLQQIDHINERPSPFPPIFKREQAVNSPSKVGENRGSLFDRCSARNGSMHPRRAFPDHENGGPVKVARVTGTIFQSVVRRSTPRCRMIVAHASPTTPARPAAPMRIVIEPTASGRKWIARLGDRVLCVTAWPFVMSARLLLAEGFPADTVIEMWRPNSDEWALRGRLGAVAATVIDGETAPRCAKNGPPDRAPEQDGHMRAPPVCARPRGRFWMDDDAIKRSNTSRRGRPHPLRHEAICRKTQSSR